MNENLEELFCRSFPLRLLTDRLTLAIFTPTLPASHLPIFLQAAKLLLGGLALRRGGGALLGPIRNGNASVRRGTVSGIDRETW